MFALTFSFPAANAQQESQPDMAFLEYLAELENVDGQWVDALDAVKSEGDGDSPGATADAHNGDVKSSQPIAKPAEALAPKVLTEKEAQR